MSTEPLSSKEEFNFLAEWGNKPGCLGG